MIKQLKERTQMFVAVGFAIGVLEALLLSNNLQENQKKAIQEAIKKLNQIKNL